MGTVCTKDQDKFSSDDVADLYPQFSKANGSARAPHITVSASENRSGGGGTGPNSRVDLREAAAATPQSAAANMNYNNSNNSSIDSNGIKSNINWEAIEKETQAENYTHLKRDYLENPDQFLANMLLLSVQMFRNFDK